MRQSLDGHHKVMHTPQGPFAKLRANGITLPGQAAAQTQTHSTVTVATPLWPASVRSGGALVAATYPTNSSAGMPGPTQVQGLYTAPSSHLPSFRPEMEHSENTDFTASLYDHASLSGQSQQNQRTSLGADPFASAIDQERDNGAEQHGFGESTQEHEAYAPHTSDQT